jgi:hypothetical protein
VEKQAPETLFAGKSLAALEAALAARQEFGVRSDPDHGEDSPLYRSMPRKGI